MKLQSTVSIMLLVCLVAGALGGCGSPTATNQQSEPLSTNTTAPSPTPSPELVAATDTVPVAQPTPTESPPQPVPTESTPQPTTVPSPTPSPEPVAATDTVPAPQPTPTESPPSPTTAPSPTPEPAGPEGPLVKTFTVSSQVVRNVGDSLYLAWEAVGERAELCPIQCYPVMCQEVPLSGEMTWVADEVSLGYNGFALRASAAGQEALKAVHVSFLCENQRQWFFDNPYLLCPQDDPISSYAAGQYFERGFMIWVKETDEFYVFETEPGSSNFKQFYTTTGLALKPGASEDNRVGEDPPPGLYEPVSGFGLVWRGEVEWSEAEKVRERLGWATEPEFGFDTAWQYAVSTCPRSWTKFMRGPRGEIVHLGPATTIGWPLTWDWVSE